MILDRQLVRRKDYWTLMGLISHVDIRLETQKRVNHCEEDRVIMEGMCHVRLFLTWLLF